MAEAKEYALDISLADEARQKLLKLVLTYESAKRGLSLGQTLALLVELAVDVNGYPEEVRSCLEEIEQNSRMRAAEKVCNSIELPRSA